MNLKDIKKFQTELKAQLDDLIDSNPITMTERSLRASALSQCILTLCELDKRQWIKNGGFDPDLEK